MKNQDQLIRDELRQLITRSCSKMEKTESNDYYGFHKALLKFFFEAADVTIDEENKLIKLWTSGIDKNNEDKLYWMQDAYAVEISYNNLADTLKGCIEKGANQTRFYKSLLFHYNRVADTAGTIAYSA